MGVNRERYATKTPMTDKHATAHPRAEGSVMGLYSATIVLAGAALRSVYCVRPAPCFTTQSNSCHTAAAANSIIVQASGIGYWPAMGEQDEPGANSPQVPSQPGNARPSDALPGPRGASAPPADGPAQGPQDSKAANAKRPRGTLKHDPTEAPDSHPSPSALAASEEQGRDSKRKRISTNGSSKDATAAQQQQAQRAAAEELRATPSPMKAAAETATLAEAAAALLAPTSAAGAAADEAKSAIIVADACREAADQVEWVPLLKGLGDPGSSCPEAGPWQLQLPTTASADLWLQYREDPDIFNVGLVGDTSATDAKPVPVAAVDMLVASEWFRGLIGHRKQLAGSLRSSSLHALPLPLRVERDALETLVRGLYEGQLHLGPGNMEAVLRAADAMQVSDIEGFMCMGGVDGSPVNCVAKHA